MDEKVHKLILRKQQDPKWLLTTEASKELLRKGQDP